MMSFKRVTALLAVTVAASTVMASIAEAQNRRGPLRVTVQKRSYLDAGNVVPVGSMTVSYTHLDVYKRQPRSDAMHPRGQAAPPS